MSADTATEPLLGRNVLASMRHNFRWHVGTYRYDVYRELRDEKRRPLTLNERLFAWRAIRDSYARIIAEDYADGVEIPPHTLAVYRAVRARIAKLEASR